METRSESSKSSSAELLVTLAISLLLTQHQTAAVARMNQWTLRRLQLRLRLGAGSHLTQRRTTQYLTPPLQWGRGSLQLSSPGATTGARQTLPPTCSSNRHQQQYSQH